MASKNSRSLPDEDSQAVELRTERFAKLLDQLEKKGVSQGEAARRVKVPAQYISDVKAGRRVLSELFARRLEEEFGVDYRWLLADHGSLEVPELSISGHDPEARRVWMPVFPHPVSGDPHAIASWDGTSVDLAGAAAAKVLTASHPYVLRFGAEDRRGLLRKGDLVLVSQALDPAAEIQVVKQGAKMFLARRSTDERWETVSTTGTMRGQEVQVAGHCLGIIWRAL